MFRSRYTSIERFNGEEIHMLNGIQKNDGLGLQDSTNS